MPGKSKKGGGLKVSPYKLKGHALPGPSQSKASPFKNPAIAAAVIGSVAGAVVGKMLSGKSKVGGPGLTDPGEELGKLKIGTGQQEDPIQY